MGTLLGINLALHAPKSSWQLIYQNFDELNPAARRCNKSSFPLTITAAGYTECRSSPPGIPRAGWLSFIESDKILTHFFLFFSLFSTHRCHPDFGISRSGIQSQLLANGLRPGPGGGPSAFVCSGEFQMIMVCVCECGGGGRLWGDMTHHSGFGICFPWLLVIFLSRKTAGGERIILHLEWNASYEGMWENAGLLLITE